MRQKQEKTTPAVWPLRRANHPSATERVRQRISSGLFRRNAADAGRRAPTRESKYDMIVEWKNFYIARSGHDPEQQYGGYFKGMIDQVRVYERALSAKEVRRNFKATRRQYVE